MQESRLINVDYGDRDSLGLFQQRPSQGWGSEEQVQDPVHAANKFYEELVDVSGWESMPVTVAAQRVQRSAFPNAYAQWEDEATVMAAVLTGRAGAGLACSGDVATTELTADDVYARATEALGRTVSASTSGSAFGWAAAAWIVGHAPSLGVVEVSYAGRTWTPATGSWSAPSDTVPRALTVRTATT